MHFGDSIIQTAGVVFCAGSSSVELWLRPSVKLSNGALVEEVFAAAPASAPAEVSDDGALQCVVVSSCKIRTGIVPAIRGADEGELMDKVPLLSVELLTFKPWTTLLSASEAWVVAFPTDISTGWCAGSSGVGSMADSMDRTSSGISTGSADVLLAAAALSAGEVVEEAAVVPAASSRASRPDAASATSAAFTFDGTSGAVMAKLSLEALRAPAADCEIFVTASAEGNTFTASAGKRAERLSAPTPAKFEDKLLCGCSVKPSFWEPLMPELLIAGSTASTAIFAASVDVEEFASAEPSPLPLQVSLPISVESAGRPHDSLVGAPLEDISVFSRTVEDKLVASDDNSVDSVTVKAVTGVWGNLTW